jgi:FRG domain-containing protein
MPAWNSTTLPDLDAVRNKMMELQGLRWLCRGQGRPYGRLQPSLDRCAGGRLSRLEKLTLERQSIDVFRSTARFFAGEGEMGALHSDITTLMVMRHYGVPTRLLDWSLSPFVAAFFASEVETQDGEVWVFSYDQYILKGNEQWSRMPEALTNGQWDPGRTVFIADDPPDWFTCNFYSGFPRQDAQRGLYSLTAKVGLDHDAAIASLLVDPNFFHRYVIPSGVKREVLRFLREQHGIWRGSLFPDSAGAAVTVIDHVFPRA